MKALSIKQPWASLIALGIKDIENRKWKTHFRGRIYIHASAKSAGDLPYVLNDEQGDCLYYDEPANLYEHEKIISSIIGEVEIVDCVTNHKSIWAEANWPDEKPIYNWVLANAVLYDKPIQNVKGRLSFWEF